MEFSNKKITDDLNKIIIGNKSKSDYLNKCKILIDIFVSHRESYLGGNDVENQNMEQNEVPPQNINKNANDNLIKTVQIENNNFNINLNDDSQNNSANKKKKKEKK